MREQRERDRVRGEIWRSGKRMIKVLPWPVLALAILSAFVQMPIEITLSFGVVGLILVLIAYPGFWIRWVPFVRDSKLVAWVIFKCSMPDWEEETKASAKLKSFVKTPYGFQATVYLPKLSAMKRWEDIRPAIAESFDAMGVQKVEIKEEALGTGTGRILVQLFQKLPESGGNFSYDR